MRLFPRCRDDEPRSEEKPSTSRTDWTLGSTTRYDTKLPPLVRQQTEETVRAVEFIGSFLSSALLENHQSGPEQKNSLALIQLESAQTQLPNS